MPAYSSPSNGNFQTVAAVPLRFQTLTFPGAGGQSTLAVFADGLPALCAWFLETAGGAVVSVQLQFANGNVGGGVGWQPLVPAYMLIAGVPSNNKFSIGSRQFRATLTALGAATVQCRLNGALT